MDRVEAFDGLDFYDDEAVDQHVDSQIIANSIAAVVDRYVLLEQHSKVGQLKFECQGVAVDRLEQPRTEGFVNLHRSADDRLREIPMGSQHVRTISRKRATRNYWPF